MTSPCSARLDELVLYCFNAFRHGLGALGGSVESACLAFSASSAVGSVLPFSTVYSLHLKDNVE